MDTGKKARVLISLRPDVLDVQGQTIKASLESLGFKDVKGMRVGKFIEIEMNGPIEPNRLQEIEDISRDVLTNPIIEDFKVELI